MKKGQTKCCRLSLSKLTLTFFFVGVMNIWIGNMKENFCTLCFSALFCFSYLRVKNDEVQWIHNMYADGSLFCVPSVLFQALISTLFVFFIEMNISGSSQSTQTCPQFSYWCPLHPSKTTYWSMNLASKEGKKKSENKNTWFL